MHAHKHTCARVRACTHTYESMCLLVTYSCSFAQYSWMIGSWTTPPNTNICACSTSLYIISVYAVIYIKSSLDDLYCLMQSRYYGNGYDALFLGNNYKKKRTCKFSTDPIHFKYFKSSNNKSQLYVCTQHIVAQ